MEGRRESNRGKARMVWDKPINGGLVFLLPVTQLNSSAWLPVALVTMGQTCSFFINGWTAITLTHETVSFFFCCVGFFGGAERLEGIFFSLRHQITPCCPPVCWKCKITGPNKRVVQLETSVKSLIYYLLSLIAAICACTTRCCSVRCLPVEIMYDIVLCYSVIKLMRIDKLIILLAL